MQVKTSDVDDYMTQYHKTVFLNADFVSAQLVLGIKLTDILKLDE